MLGPRHGQHVRAAEPVVTEVRERANDALVAIPTIGASDLLPGLLDFLLLDSSVKVIELYVNDPTKVRSVRNIVRGMKTCDNSKIRIRRAPEKTIYPSWNMALDSAELLGLTAFILNDDIDFPELDPITEALNWWARNDDRDIAIMGFDHTAERTEVGMCEGSFRHGGIPGFAFGADPTRCARVDEQFGWWYGDDDLFFGTAAKGHKLALCPVAVRHEASTTASKAPWTDAVIAQDVVRWRAKWGDR